MADQADLKVVPLRGPPLTDIASQLERLAADVRDGKLQPAVALVLLADERDRISLYGHGQIRGAAHTIGLLDVAKHFLLNKDAAENA